MKNKKYSKGFTLVELLVVIAIIGILAAVVLVSLSAQRDKARRSSAEQTMKSIMPSAVGCLTEGGDVKAPTDTSAGGGNVCSLGSYTGIVWPSLVTGSTQCTYGTIAGGTMACTSADQATCTPSITCAAGNITCSYNTGSCL
jgi:prepilin-type N-terminal cleavage/methylation domain-containing protein